MLNDGYFLYRHAWRFNLAPHQEERLQKPQWKGLLALGGIMVRNTYDFDHSEEQAFWYLIKDSFEGLEGLSSNNRNKVRRALSSFDYRLIDQETVQEQGYAILQATFRDYGASDRSLSEKEFEAQMSRGKRDGFEYWGVFDKETNDFIGWCDVHPWADCCEYGVIGILPKYKHNSTYPYYGLFYSMNAYYLDERKMKYVTDGTRSITEHSNVQGFLIQNFNFRKAYCKLELHYQWWFGILVRLLYPFRKVISLPRVKAILRQEEFFRT